MKLRAARAAVVAIVAAGAVGCSSSPSPSASPSDGPAAGGQPVAALTGATPEEAAAKSLADFQAAVNADNAEALGFQSTDEVARATLGATLPVAVLTTGRLGAWDSNSAPNELWISGGLALYAVTVDGEVRSSIEVARVGNSAWQGDRFGAPHLVTAIAALAAPGDVVVEVPEMNLVFLARGTGPALTLVPVFDSPELALVAGQPSAAKDVLATLRAHRPEPSTLN